jgi:diamine N-acetyltransferase
MIGEKINLISLEKGHIETIRGWRNDPEVRKFFFSSHFINEIQQEKWFERYSEDNTQTSFAIIENNTNVFIGTIGLSQIDHYHQRAEMGTMIGNKKYWGKGYGSDSTKLLLSYAFNSLNLKKVYCNITSDNIASIKKNEKVGFKIEGTLRKHTFNNGTFKDVIVMGMLKEDYFNNN